MNNMEKWEKIFEIYLSGEKDNLRCPVCGAKELSFTEDIVGERKIINAFCHSCNSHEEIIIAKKNTHL